MARKEIEVFSADSDGESYDVTLPVNKSEFADFLGKIIGGKDKLDFSFSGDLHVTPDLLFSIETALTERVETQNGGKLVSSRYGVKLSDGKGFKTSNIEKILSISPAPDVYTRYFSVEYIFLIKYPDNDFPAREKISIFFGGSESLYYSSVRCEIEYFNRIWAEECLNRIKSIVDQVITVPKDVSYIKNAHFLLGESFAPFVFCVAAFIYTIFIFVFLEILSKYFDLSTIESGDIEARFDYLINSYKPHFIFVGVAMYLLIGAVVSVIPAILVSERGYSHRENSLTFELYKYDSYIINKMNEYKRKKIRKMLGVLFFAIISSLIAAAIYDLVLTIIF